METTHSSAREARPLASAAGPDGAGPVADDDARLCDAVAARIARPKRAAADSFVLHAPLELLARAALLPLVRRTALDGARARIAALGDAYAAAGDEVEPAGERKYDDAGRAVADLGRAIDTGALDDADAIATWLAATLAPDALVRALGDDLVPRLGAAAHGAIFLHELPRVLPRSPAAARMLRGLVRELAREGTCRLAWFRARRPDVAPASDLVARLLAPPSPGSLDTSFIYPTMHLVETSGLASELLDAATRALEPSRASRVLGRVAAWSMLQDDPAHAPYGWSHTLTMPRATLGIARSLRAPADAVAVAATYVLGFRATLGRVRLDPAWAPAPPAARDPLPALDGASPAEAAAAAWHARPDDVPRVVEALATRASLHHDAHLVKYTRACLDAGRADPEAGRLYLAAAASLSAWWRAADGAEGG